MISRRFLLFASTASTILLKQPSYADNKPIKSCNKCASPSPVIFWNQSKATLPKVVGPTTNPSHTAILHTYIPTPHPTRDVVQQTLVDWVKKSTRDYQLLEFAPENLPIQIAFLRLIGVQNISLKQFSREKGSKQCFLNELTNIHDLKDATPLLTHNSEEILATISEFNTERCDIVSLDTGIHNPIDHVRPTLYSKSETTFHKNEIAQLYKLISQLTDDEIREFCDLFLINEGPQNKKIVFENLQKAREICANYTKNNMIPVTNYARIY